MTNPATTIRTVLPDTFIAATLLARANRAGVDLRPPPTLDGTMRVFNRRDRRQARGFRFSVRRPSAVGSCAIVPRSSAAAGQSHSDGYLDLRARTRDGTSVKEIDCIYGHLARDSEDAIRDRLEVRGNRDGVGRGGRVSPRTRKPPVSRRFLDGSDGTRTRDLRRDRPAF